MKDVELVEKSDIAVVESISVDQVPAIIVEEFQALNKYKKNVDAAMEKASKAQKAAKFAKDYKTGIFRNTGAIESLQSATKDLADAQFSATEAQQVSFEYQEKLGEITKFLFALGVKNMASNRAVIRELELKLRDATDEEMDELAKQEILSVLKQLKAQEDIMKKQADLNSKVKENSLRLKEHQKKEDEYDKLLEEHARKEKEQDRRLADGEKKDKEQDEILKGHSKKDEEHDKRLNEGAKKDAEHDRKLNEGAKKDEEHDRRLDLGDKRDTEQDNRLTDLEDQVKVLEEKVEELSTQNAQLMGIKSNKAMVYIAYLIGAVGIVISIIHFFI